MCMGLCARIVQVLAVVEEEGLQANALDVGSYARRRLRDELMPKHAAIGDVRGSATRTMLPTPGAFTSAPCTPLTRPAVAWRALRRCAAWG